MAVPQRRGIGGARVAQRQPGVIDLKAVEALKTHDGEKRLGLCRRQWCRQNGKTTIGRDPVDRTLHRLRRPPVVHTNRQHIGEGVGRVHGRHAR